MIERLITFLKEVQVEMKKVTWPTREQTIQYTIAVISISAVLAAFLGGLDYVFQKVINTFIL
ncbi:MAG: preprotein translocase subunit SecE [Candidatus Sungbacteria bacterium RIFCSPLOWO2_02_FULL_47_9]|uniref:Protein translocase subunit SecE n=1 Tax=Candidatus Sungbacteria bacterium RIFCSPHIGHO2_01_FULL_47_32 TaxID=1802264 RepID=A0A1G2K9W6_9BACT|nr:MAG: protein translocase subunit secE/sec61 gamma [Parcubacteria group bacterium GW2011_GWA2_47_10]OGZ95331.1 MAG: preprotein translocase subunit SecE [Candidatus Sungbacteria bacterium RIFCSPHIGHO2_01_FULL_47_32]OGZ98730.1 MAG: preprotein translocase subunit SecE [Candidatus Sungbacteria bacterium RIFCSPHIGHO2_02_FULL_46_12]OHA06348.1 MAG: preprotein translocase subunit SecE [Candidatus Sungbacteria bacterium RIFCSPLOWO2_01_FULL_47_32]OHA08555.1 MAG: preprotein translocase subunit SecE [Can